MSSKLDALLDRVKSWPAARQAEAETILEAIEHQDARVPRISDEQAAEIERRLAEPSPRFLTLAETRARLANRRA